MPHLSPIERRWSSRKVVIVWGPPCGGKNTYIEEHWSPGDLLIDYDDITAAFCRQSKHIPALHRDQTHWVVYAAIQAAIAELRMKDFPGTVWLPAMHLKRVEAILRAVSGARLVKIDPGREECEQRAKLRPVPQHALEGIERWYAARQ